MPRTTANIDAGVLKDLKHRAKQEGKSLGQVISEIAASALKNEPPGDREPVAWVVRPMGARVDLTDKDTVNAASNQ